MAVSILLTGASMAIRAGAIELFPAAARECRRRGPDPGHGRGVRVLRLALPGPEPLHAPGTGHRIGLHLVWEGALSVMLPASPTCRSGSTPLGASRRSTSCRFRRPSYADTAFHPVGRARRRGPWRSPPGKLMRFDSPGHRLNFELVSRLGRSVDGSSSTNEPIRSCGFWLYAYQACCTQGGTGGVSSPSTGCGPRSERVMYAPFEHAGAVTELPAASSTPTRRE